ncbi:hypothetical protein AVEN_100562-1 [Araneus ventricosus]|uniref:Uncharacterized protein n=1 Tax=Araneus ventricosus TaxID=182803 RepID=A0A4Y2FHY7_ARAVE|nr:hypothetical protein AVEN_100562-1 [Araneus ventricosus]
MLARLCHLSSSMPKSVPNCYNRSRQQLLLICCGGLGSVMLAQPCHQTASSIQKFVPKSLHVASKCDPDLRNDLNMSSLNEILLLAQS